MYVCVFNIQQCKLSKTKREEKKNCLAKGVTEQPFREKYNKRKQVLLMKMPLKKICKKKISWQSNLPGL